MTFGPSQVSDVSVHLAAFGQVGVDVPLSLKQQHALNLLPNQRGDHKEEARNQTGDFPANSGLLAEASRGYCQLEVS